MKLSIIIPAYKVEKYIEKTLRSILNQDFDKSQVEIIVVIDGSPDNSEKVVRSLVKEGFDINILVQTNQGLSMARNNGLERASGEYVWFVDSDDWLPNDSIKTLIGLMDGSVDEIDFGAIEIADDEKTFVANKSFVEEESSYSMSGVDIWKKKRPHIATAQLSVYRRHFLLDNDIYFYNGIFHEDYEFCPRASLLSSKTIVLNQPFYYQRVNPTSITHSFNPKRSYDYIQVAKSLYNFIINKSVSHRVKRRFFYYIGMAINNALENMRFCNSHDRVSFNEYIADNKAIIHSFFKSFYLPYIIEAIALYISVDKYVEVYERLKSITK